MKTFHDCIPCFLKQSIEVTKMVAPKNDTILDSVTSKVLKYLTTADFKHHPPVLARDIHKIIKEETQNPDPFKHLKEKYNAIALKLYPKLKELVQASENPFETAVKLSIVGNIIDFGIASCTQTIDVESAILGTLQQEPYINHISAFEKEIKKAETILYLGDNTGEIVFDKVFIEYLQTLEKKITFVVRKYPIINDINYEDAVLVGLTEIVRVVDNGLDVPGTYLKESPAHLKHLFDTSDIIISKGQGNFETLSEVNYNIFFLFKAKCQVVSDHVGCNLNDILVKGQHYT